MRIKKGSTVLVTVVDGTVLRGSAAWSWRWRVLRLVDVVTYGPHGPTPVGGAVLLPHRSVVMAQEVSDGDPRS